MFWEGDMIAASAVMDLRVICPPFLRSTMVTWEGSTQTIQLSDDIVVRPCLMEVSGTPNAVSCFYGDVDDGGGDRGGRILLVFIMKAKCLEEERCELKIS